MALLLAVAMGAGAQPQKLEDLQAPQATSERRAALLQELRRDKIELALRAPLSAETEKQYQGAFWASELLAERSPALQRALEAGLTSWDARSEGFRRATLEALYALYPNEFRMAVTGLLPRVTDRKLFAMAVYYLRRADGAGVVRASLLKTTKARFPKWEEDPILKPLVERLERDLAGGKEKRPPVVDLLRHRFPGGKPVLFSLQRPDRRQPGLAVLRGKDGRFVRRADGSLFAIAHLALSSSNLPGTITNGNAPQGVYSIKGEGVTENQFIGPTPFLWSRLPVEATPGDWHHHAGAAPANWTQDWYNDALPATWRSEPGMQEAWYAGSAGRAELLLHGTTIDPTYYKDQPYYPLTPSMGCLCPMELWSPEDGRVTCSDQWSLLQAWRSTGSAEGFLVVLELEDRKAPVLLAEVLPAMLEAERARAGSP